MIILDENNQTPNVLHFHGMNRDQLPITFNTILNEHEVNTLYDPTQLDIISCWTDNNQCCLLQQCNRFNIPLINAVPDDYDRTQKWFMPNKIKFFIQALERSNKDIIMFLDGYDVLLVHLDDIIRKFQDTGYRILFNPSCNNYPDVIIDKIYSRAKMGLYRYFNAGCCIGYREDLLNFYKKALQLINIKNPFNSEQLVLRHVFRKYSNNPTQKYVGIDYTCTLFKSMGCTDSSVSNDHTSITFKQNRIPESFYISINTDVDDSVITDRTQVYDLTDEEQSISGFLKVFDINAVYCDKDNEQIPYIKTQCDKYGVDLIIK